MLLRTLGGLKLEGSDFTRPKPLLLLAYLALEGPKERRFLSELFWMGATDPLNRLSTALARLRKVAPGVINADDVRVWTEIETDARQLLSAVEAGEDEKVLSLYKGPFLEGIYLQDWGEELEEWVYQTREYLAERARAVLLKLAEKEASQGRFDSAAKRAEAAYKLAGASVPEAEELPRFYTLMLAGGSPYATELRQEAEGFGIVVVYSPEEAREGLRQALEVTYRSMRHHLPVQPKIEEPIFVARHHELARLSSHLDASLAGRHRVVFVVGEAGQGKTSLLQAFARHAQEASSNLVVATGNCNAYTGMGDPYLPFREILEQFTGDVEARVVAGTLRRDHAIRLWHSLPTAVQALVECGPDLLDTFLQADSLLQRATSYDSESDGWLTQLQALIARKAAIPDGIKAQQSALFAEYTKTIQMLTRQAPLLLLLDDLQWIDSASADLLLHLGKHLTGYRVLILGAYRPDEVTIGRDGERHPLERIVNEFRRDFGNIILDLNQSEGRAFIDELLDAEPNRLNSSFRETLYQQTEGHPLFTVELLRGMQERGDLVKDEADHWVAKPDLDWQTLPARTEGAIGERIGRLETSLRELLRIASAEGEEFTVEVVSQVINVAPREVMRQLSQELDKKHQLVRALGIRREGNLRLTRYRFQHHLIQRYLYGSLDEIECQYLHEAIAKELERLYAGRTLDVAVELAWHYERAGLIPEAVAYLKWAAEDALQRSAHREAIDHLARGLELLEQHPEIPDHGTYELAFQAVFAPTLIAIQGWAAPRAEHAYLRACELSVELGQHRQLSTILYGLATLHELRGEYDQTQRVLRERLQLPEEARDGRVLVESHELMACSKFHQGLFGDALQHANNVWQQYDPEQHLTLTAFLAENPGVASHHWAALSLWFLGYPDQALARIQKALYLAQDIDHSFSLAHAQEQAAVLHQLRLESQATLERAEATIALASERGYPYRIGTGTLLKGWAMAAQGQHEEGIAQIREGLHVCLATGAKIDHPYFLALLADAHRRAGQTDAGLEAVEEALGLVRNSRAFFFEAELHRLWGLLLLQKDAQANVDEAIKSFEQALKLARHQKAKILELRAVMIISRLWAKQGKRAEARQMLAESFSWFSEGFNTVDLQAAQGLLESLQP